MERWTSPSITSLHCSGPPRGGRIEGTLGDIDPLNKVLLKRARSRVQKGYPLRGLPNTTPYPHISTLAPGLGAESLGFRV